MVRIRVTACQPTSKLGFWIKCNGAPNPGEARYAFSESRVLIQARQGAKLTEKLISVRELEKRRFEPHSRSQGRSQPPNFTNTSLLETYRLHASNSFRRFERKINGLPTFPRLFPA